MGYTNFNMRLDDELRANAYPVLEKYGLTPSQAVRMFFNQIANTGKIPLSFDWNELVPNERTLAAINELNSGGGSVYASLEELLARNEYAAE